MKTNKGLARVVYFGLYVVGAAFFYNPVVAVLHSTDWAHPYIEVNGEMYDGHAIYNESTGFETKITVEWSETQALRDWYHTTKIPWHLGWWMSWIIGCVLIALGFFISFFDDFDHDSDILKRILAAHGVCWFGFALYLVVFFSDHATMAGWKDASIPTLLSDAVLGVYPGRLAKVTTMGAFGLIVLNVVAIAFCTVIAWIAETVEHEFDVSHHMKKWAYRYLKVSPDDEIVIVGDSISVCRSKIVFELFPFPVLRAVRRVTLRANLEKTLARAGRHDYDPDEDTTVARSLALRVHEEFRQNANGAETAFRGSVLKNMQTHAGSRAAALTNEKLDALRKNARTCLQEASDKTLAKFKEDLLAGALETATDALVPFKKMVLENLRGRVLDVVKDVQTTISPALPFGTRFFAMRGDLTMVVVEQQPHVHTIRFDDHQIDELAAMALKLGKVEITKEQRAKKKENPRFELAMPYLTYVLTFKSGAWGGRLWVFAKSRTLSGTEDSLGLLPLTNVDPSGWICLGDNPKIAGSITEQTELVIRHFWQSKFRLHMNTEQLEYLHETHPDLKSLWHWKEETRKNPAHILQAHFKSASFNNLQEMWSGHTEKIREESILTYDALVARAMEDGEVELKKMIREFLAAVSVDRRFTRTIEESLDAHLKETAKAIAQYVFDKEVAKLPELVDDPDVRYVWFEEMQSAVQKVLTECVVRVARGEIGLPPLISREKIEKALQREGVPE